MKKFLSIVKCIVSFFSKQQVGRIKNLLFFLFWSAFTFAQTSPISLGELQPFWRSQPVLGPFLQDSLNIIAVPDYMSQTDFPYQKRSFSKEVPFADNLSVVRLLGGYSSYPGISGKLTNSTTPEEGIALLEKLRVYDFVYRNDLEALVFRPELIEDRLQPYLGVGYEDLTIVLDNIPWDLTQNPSFSSYGNKGVPDVAEEWYETIKELCNTLVGIMGVDKANKLRFRIGTEMNGLERFDGTEDEFITHYDYAAAAIQDVLPGATLSLFNISSAKLHNINSVHNVGSFRVLDHIANEANRKTGNTLNNIPNFVSVSRYFYEDLNLTDIVTGLDQIWDYVNDDIPGYQNKFSREIHEFGGQADWNADPATNNEGAFGGAMTLQLFIGYMEIGIDRIYHWNSFRSIPDGANRYEVPTSQAWMYSVLEYLSGGDAYKILPDEPTLAGGAKVTSILSVKDGTSYLLVNSFDTDRENTEETEVVLRIPKSYLPSVSLAETEMTSLTHTNCVLNEIRRDVETAGNLNPLLDGKPDYIPSKFQDFCGDYEVFKAMVLSNATKYEDLWKESLTLDPFDGNITEEGDNFVIKLNMTASQNTVIVFHDTKKTGTLTASPQVVTAFTNDNGTGNTALTWTSDGAAKVVITHSRTINGGTPTAETGVITNTQLQKTDHAINYIKDGGVHTFKLYATAAGVTDFNTGTFLASVVVTGDLPATGTVSASPEIVTAFTNQNGTGNSTISWSTANSPRTLITLTRTSVDGTIISAETLVIKNNNPSSSVNAGNISEGNIHTFKLYTGQVDLDDLGDLLDTVIVYGGDVLVYTDGAWVNSAAMDGTTAAKDVYIFDDLTLSSIVEINNLDIAPGGNLTINAGVSLKVNGTSSGNVTYNTTLGTENWYLVSSPVAGETYDNAYVTANSLSINGTNNAIGSYTTVDNTWSYMQTGGGGTFTPGIGYSVRRAAAASSATISFTGTINTSDVAASVVLGGTDGFNLIGNPFTAYLNSASFLTGNTANLVSETMWVWNEATANYETKVTADAFVLAPTQGFFVSASSATNLSIAESYQATTGSAFQKTTKTEVKLMINDGTSSRFAKVYYLDNATTGFDNGFDGETFGGIANTVDVFTHLVADSEGKNYQIQSLPNSDFETMVIPVGITADAGKEITFTAEAMNLQEGLKVFLEDKVTNAMTRLDQANATYKVTLNDALNGIGRFYVHTKASGVLSTTDVTLQNVSVYTTDKTILRVVGLSQGKASVKLYNMLGKQVFATSFNSVGVKDMNLPTLATGIYVVQLETESGKLNKKITLE
jgi:hypothetical protein